MIAEFINSSLEYLLGDTDSAGRLRRSELVEGNLPSLLEARKMAAKYKHPHITVSYREPKPLERIGGYGFEERLKEDILETFLPGLDRSQFHYAFIRHHNGDGSYELNFFLLQMTSGRQFTAYWDKKDRKLHELLSRKIHQENRSLTNPWEERPELIVPARASINDGAKTAKEIEELLEDALKRKLVKGREDFLRLIRGRGYEITRAGRDYFTVKKDGKRIKFKGQAANEDFNPQKIIPIRKYDPTDYTPLWREACERKKKQLTNKYKFIKGNIYERQSNEHRGQIPGTLPEQNGAPDIEAERTGRSGKDQAPDRKQALANGGKNIGSERTLVRIKENAAECRGIFKELACEPVQSVIGSHIRRNFARIAGSIAAGIASLAGKVIRRALGGIFQEIGRLPESNAKRREETRNQDCGDHGYYGR